MWHRVDGELPQSSPEGFPQILMGECLHPSGHMDECLPKALAPTCSVWGTVLGCRDNVEYAAMLAFCAADVVSTEKAARKPGEHPVLRGIKDSKSRLDCQ